ncbi:MAG: isoprenylcysteine carboxylmethyltransferase family protein [Alphaproteobacteria bacterium]|nr:isoprenylcysteine carboxylmethyltransferase family protein [Alphaproteobacteria bacterium]
MAQRLTKKSLIRLSVIRFVVLVAVVFVCAGTFDYWRGWVFIAVFTTCNGLSTAYLWKNNPALMARRMAAGFSVEKEKSQKIIALLLSFIIKLLLVFSVLDHRLQAQPLSLWDAMVGNALIVTGFCITFVVFRVNGFASATVEAMNNHKIIVTGPYAIIRHPMYIGSLCILFGTPLALGSCRGLLISSLAVPLFVWRTIEEERFLGERMPDYKKYQAATRWRLVPGVF